MDESRSTSPTDRRPSVLFLCNHNSARSQMAEAMLRHFAGDRFRAFSAGIGRKDIKPGVRFVMEEAGFSLEGQYGKTLEELADLPPFDHLIIVCETDESGCPGIRELARRKTRWEIVSPFPGVSPSELGESEKTVHYRSLRDQIRGRIEDWLGEVADQGSEMPGGSSEGSPGVLASMEATGQEQ